MTQQEINDRISDLKEKIKELENTKPDPVYRSWEDLEKEYYEFRHFNFYDPNFEFKTVKDIHVPIPTKKILKKIVATGKLALLMQLPEYNGDWKPDYSNGEKKYAIFVLGNKIETEYYKHYYVFLSFKTEEIRDAFLEKNIELIKDYFELDSK